MAGLQKIITANSQDATHVREVAGWLEEAVWLHNHPSSTARLAGQFVSAERHATYIKDAATQTRAFRLIRHVREALLIIART